MLGIFSSLIATRVGAPLLLVFLVVGMLAGEDGPGGIAFDNYADHLPRRLGRACRHPLRRRPAHAALGLPRRPGTIADRWRPSGCSSPRRSPALPPSTLIDFAPAEALLLGSIVASTDAAAVFFLIRTGGLRLQSRVGSTLEIESGTNDPFAMLMAVILTEFIVAGHGTSLVGARPLRRRGGGDRRGPRRRRRLRPRRGAQQHPDAGRAAPALRRRERDPHLRPHLDNRRQRAPCRLSSPGSSSPTARRAPTPPSSASTTPRPGSARS